MKNYQIIADEAELERFLALLPDTTPDECYYVSLMARNKWLRGTDVPKIGSQIQLKRFTSDKKRLATKLRQLECAVGTYIDKDLPIPQEALGVYISVNPRSYRRSGLRLIREIAEQVEKNADFNPHQLALSCLQTTASRRPFFDIDIDLMNDETREPIVAFIREIVGEAATFVHTRGGLHCLVATDRLSPEQSKTWYNAIAKQTQFKSGFDMIGDNLTPLPGCVQGGFVPTLYKG
ncbi:MAG: hypothetical protein WCR52_00695 [Bacteroidota bacterium]